MLFRRKNSAETRANSSKGRSGVNGGLLLNPPKPSLLPKDGDFKAKSGGNAEPKHGPAATGASTAATEMQLLFSVFAVVNSLPRKPRVAGLGHGYACDGVPCAWQPGSKVDLEIHTPSSIFPPRLWLPLGRAVSFVFDSGQFNCGTFPYISTYQDTLIFYLIRRI
jgi:hypothetical protein